jgi:hypothetical protein
MGRNNHMAGGAGAPFGSVPVANPKTNSGCAEPDFPAELGNATVTVAVAPGRRLVAGVEALVSAEPKILNTAVTLFAAMSPVLVTEIVTLYPPEADRVIDESAALIRRKGIRTVRDVEPAVLPSVAVIVVWPRPTAVAVWPFMVATARFEEDQITRPVRSCVLPSLNAPMATNDCVAPFAIVEFAGITVIV